MTLSDNDFHRLVGFIKTNYGVDLRQKRHLIEGRLSTMIQQKGYEDFSSYIDFALHDSTGAEINVLINKLTTNHTYFMREFNHFEYYRDKALPYWADRIRDGDLRVWSAACSSGQEPYTLAMINNDFFERDGGKWNTQILATDISMNVLQTARAGIYDAEGVKDVPEVWRKKYFVKLPDSRYQMREDLRNNVVFRTFNLMNTTLPFKRKFHVIFCRNVMIYFDKQTKTELIERFYDMTEPGGFLFIGHSESIEHGSTRYQYVQPALYRKVIK